MANAITAFIPAIWDAEGQLARYKIQVWAPLVNRDYEGELKYGDRVKVPVIQILTANDTPTTGDDTVVVQTLAGGTNDIIINKRKDATFFLTSRELEQCINEAFRMEYTAQAGKAIGQQIDADLATLEADATSQVGTAGTHLTLATFLAAIQKLDEANVPSDERVFVGSPAAVNDLRAIDNLILAAAFTGNRLVNEGIFLDNGEPTPGYFGRLYGVDIYISNNVVKSGSSPVATHNLMFHRSAIAFIQQKMDMFSEETVFYELLKDRYLISPKTAYGALTMRPDHMVRVLS